jgi:hypothetical protein
MNAESEAAEEAFSIVKRKGLTQSLNVSHVTALPLIPKKTPSSPHTQPKHTRTLSEQEKPDDLANKQKPKEGDKKRKNRPKSMIFSPAGTSQSITDLRSSGGSKKEKRKTGKSFDYEESTDKISAAMSTNDDTETPEQKRTRRKSQVLPPIMYKEKEDLDKKKKNSKKKSKTPDQSKEKKSTNKT